MQIDTSDPTVAGAIHLRAIRIGVAIMTAILIFSAISGIGSALVWVYAQHPGNKPLFLIFGAAVVAVAISSFLLPPPLDDE